MATAELAKKEALFVIDAASFVMRESFFAAATTFLICAFAKNVTTTAWFVITAAKNGWSIASFENLISKKALCERLPVLVTHHLLLTYQNLSTYRITTLFPH